MSAYDSDFYARNLKFQSALGKEIVPFLIKKYNPKSVIDFGCGCGKLLSMFEIRAITGINGDIPENIQIPNCQFLKSNLINPISMKVKYDFVISLEVAEHLPESSADIFIKSLVNAARGPIMFSAATPGQGGVGHVNEQPHEYWHKKFSVHGYKPLDVIRPILKGKKSVPFWYRQNIYLYERTM